MSKIALVILLMALSNSAYAKWIRIGIDEKGVDYANLETLRGDGNFRKMWFLSDFKSVQKTIDGQEYKSTKTLLEFDCKEEKRRSIAIILTSNNMGGGNVIYTDSQFSDWSVIVPDSMGEYKWKIVCNKK